VTREQNAGLSADGVGVAPARPRGRPQRFPEDRTAMSDRQIGCEHRIAWLLATTRLLGTDPELAKRSGFIAALAERDIRVDSSRISRWESGLQPVPRAVAATYESVLGRPTGSLVAVASGLRRTFGSGTDREGSMRLVQLPEAQVEAMLDLAQSGAAGGAVWMQLAEQLGRFDRVFLRQADWARLCERLVVELATSVGVAHVRRYEAATTLMLQPSARRHLIAHVGDFLLQPDSQVHTPVMNLLGEVTNATATDLVLHLLHSGNDAQRRAAASVASVKLARSQLPETALPRLEAYVSQTLGREDPLDDGLDSLDLAANLPLTSWAAVESTLRNPRLQAQVIRWRATLELLTPRRAGMSTSALAGAVQGDTPGSRVSEPDSLLRRLLRESLVHVHKARRHQAAQLLAASPYAAAVSHHVGYLTAHPNDFVAARAWALLMRVGQGSVEHLSAERAVAESRPSIRARALVNVGLSPAPLDDAAGAALAATVADGATPAERSAALFALGMSGRPEVDTLAEHPGGWSTGPAQWWATHGPAIHEPEDSAG
jgi:hypothetical protein